MSDFDLDKIANRVRTLAVENSSDDTYYQLAMQVYFLTLALQDERSHRKTVTSPLAGDPTKEEAKDGS